MFHDASANGSANRVARPPSCWRNIASEIKIKLKAVGQAKRPSGAGMVQSGAIFLVSKTPSIPKFVRSRLSSRVASANVPTRSERNCEVRRLRCLRFNNRAKPQTIKQAAVLGATKVPAATPRNQGTRNCQPAKTLAPNPIATQAATSGNRSRVTKIKERPPEVGFCAPSSGALGHRSSSLLFN